MAFGEIDPQLLRFEGEHAKNPEATLLFVDAFKAFDSVHRGINKY